MNELLIAGFWYALGGMMAVSVALMLAVLVAVIIEVVLARRYRSFVSTKHEE